MNKKLQRILYFLLLLLLVLPAIALGALYFIPPAEEVITYNYVTEKPAASLNDKVGWYKTTEGKDYQITWGAKKGLRLNYFDQFRSNLKSIPLNPIDETQFDTDGNLETTEAEFSWEEADSTWLLEVHTSKTDLKAIKQKNEYYSQEAIEFFNDTIKLSGLLLKPYVAPSSHAVVFIHGSGVSDRDVFWYMHQADYLARRGITVLLPDKRGCGSSMGEWHTASFDDFANDAEAALAFLDNQLNDSNIKTGVIGLSQGGWISHLLANQSDHVDFVIDVVGSATTPKEQLLYEIKNDMGAVARPFAKVFAKRVRKKRKIWWEKNGDFDPIPFMEQSSLPVLKVMAADDKNVPVQKSMERLEALQKKNPQLPLTIKLFENTGHALFDEETDWIRGDYLELLVSWINKH